MQQLSTVGLGIDEINALPEGTTFTKELDQLDRTAYKAYKARQQGISIAAVDESILFSLDLRSDEEIAAAPAPFNQKISNWDLAKQLAKFELRTGLDSLGRQTGWEYTPNGSACFKLVGVYWRQGVAAFIPHVLQASGDRYPSILLARHFPGVNQFNINNPDQDLRPYYGDGSGGYTAGFTGPEGDLGMAYGPGNVMGVNGGVDVIWPVASPPPQEPQYCDALSRLGWVGGTDHLNPNPVFQVVYKGDAPDPPDPPTDPPTIPPGNDLVLEMAVNGSVICSKRLRVSVTPVD